MIKEIVELREQGNYFMRMYNSRRYKVNSIVLELRSEWNKAFEDVPGNLISVLFDETGYQSMQAYKYLNGYDTETLRKVLNNLDTYESIINVLTYTTRHGKI